MFGTTKSGVNAYARVGMETGVLAASPHRLITMLFEGALSSIALASKHMEAGNIEEKGKSIAKASAIIVNGLCAALNMEAGGEIAANLHELYHYMARRLLQANIHNDAGMLDEVRRLLLEIKEAWDAIGESQNVAESVVAPAPTAAADPLAPRKINQLRA
jgi:flagellar protein FliS